MNFSPLDKITTELKDIKGKKKTIGDTMNSHFLVIKKLETEIKELEADFENLKNVN